MRVAPPGYSWRNREASLLTHTGDPLGDAKAFLGAHAKDGGSP